MFSVLWQNENFVFVFVHFSFVFKRLVYVYVYVHITKLYVYIHRVHKHVMYSLGSLRNIQTFEIFKLKKKYKCEPEHKLVNL